MLTSYRNDGVDTDVRQEQKPIQLLPRGSDRDIFCLDATARCMGLVEGIVFQKIEFLFGVPNNGRVLKDGERWIYNTYEDWKERYFSYLTIDQIKRVFVKLERMGVLVSCQPEGKMSRRKYYRINEGYRQKLLKGEIPERAELRHRRADLRLPLYREEHSEKNEETKEAPQCGACSFLPSKEELLARKRTPKNPPTLKDYEAFIDSEPELCFLLNRAIDPFEELQARKFHAWNERRKRWEPVRDWRAYLRGLENTMRTACGGDPL